MDLERLQLAQGQQPGNGVDIGAGENYAGDRRRASMDLGMKLRRRLDLQAQIRTCVE
jgi:hypothetical protein